MAKQQTMISDGVVIGIVLGLVFAAVSYYLYSRLNQIERKVGLMENILLDLKVTTEQIILSATEPPRALSKSSASPVNSTLSNTSTQESDSEENTSMEMDENARSVSVEQSSRGSRNTPQNVVVERDDSSTSNTNYEDMKYKELIALAKQKGISGTRNLSKADVIDLIRRHDNNTLKQEPSSLKPFEEEAPGHEDVMQDLTQLLSVNQESVQSGMASLDDTEVDASLVQ